jgi:RNA polymerase sigma-70 factor (ECF subfamily)
MSHGVAGGTDDVGPADRRDHALCNEPGEGALVRTMEACRQYLLMVADRELGDDLKAKVGASDVVQETFLKAQRGFARFRGRTEGELRLWLLRILRNNVSSLARRYRKAGKRQVAREVSLDGGHGAVAGRSGLAAESPSPSTDAIRREQVQSLLLALERLPEVERRVVEWRHQEHCNFEEIGRRLGGSARSARVTWARAIKRLQAEIERAHGSRGGPDDR